MSIFEAGLRITDFDFKGLLEPMLDQARSSAVPIEFLQVFGKKFQAASMGSEEQLNDDPDLWAIANQLFKKEFPNLGSAEYALQYASMVASFKVWDQISERVQQVREEYKREVESNAARLQRIAGRLGCELDEVYDRSVAQGKTIFIEAIDADRSVVQELEAMLSKLNPLEEQAQSGAKFAGRAFLGTQSKVLRSVEAGARASFLAKLSGDKALTEQDLAVIRQEVEDFFSVRQNLANYVLLSQRPRI